MDRFGAVQPKPKRPPRWGQWAVLAVVVLVAPLVYLHFSAAGDMRRFANGLEAGLGEAQVQSLAVTHDVTLVRSAPGADGGLREFVVRAYRTPLTPIACSLFFEGDVLSSLGTCVAHRTDH